MSPVVRVRYSTRIDVRVFGYSGEHHEPRPHYICYQRCRMPLDPTSVLNFSLLSVKVIHALMLTSAGP